MSPLPLCSCRSTSSEVVDALTVSLPVPLKRTHTLSCLGGIPALFGEPIELALDQEVILSHRRKPPIPLDLRQLSD